MASSILIPLKTVLDDKGIKQAQASFGKLGSSLKGVLAAAGVGVGLGAIATALKDSTKAAGEDVKSQVLLANQLRNTVGASNEQIASVEASIKAMQTQAAVADDDIRPAFASLVRSTGDVAEATRLTSLALDVAAGTGIDLSAVATALGKSVNGSDTALLKLIPSLKNAVDPMAELQKQFNGAAEAAADNDPYAQLQTVFGEMQEQIGTYLLPYLKQFAEYVSSPDGQAALSEFADGVGTIAENIVILGKNLNSGEFLNGLASFSTFLAQLSGGKIGDAFATLDARQKALQKNLVSPDTRMMGLEVQAKSRNKAIADAAKAEIAALKKAETDTRAAYNRYSALSDAGKTLGLNVYSTGEKLKGSKFVDEAALKKAAAAAAAAAKKAAAEQAAIAKSVAAANAEMAKAAEEAMATYREQLAVYSEQVTAVNDYRLSLLDLVDAVKPLAMEEKSLGRFAQAASDSFDAIAQNVKENSEMFLDAGASLLAYVAKERVAIEKIASQRDALAEKYSLAKAVKSDVQGAIASFGNITNLLDKQSTQVTETMTSVVDGIMVTRSKLVEQTTTGNLVNNFRAILDKTKAFAVSLQKLRDLGLDQNLYKQIVDSGVDAGSATAEAIINGQAGTVGELNSIFSQLNTVGAEIGEQTAQVMYGAGVDLTNGLLEGIRSKDQELIDQAKAMASAFASAFNSELSLNLASPTAPVMPGLGIDATDFIPGYGRVSSTGTNPAGQNVYNIKVEAGMIASKQEIPAMIVDALGTYTKQSGAGGLTRILGL